MLLRDDIHECGDVAKGHGRREKRTIRTTTILNDYLDWPAVGQVFWIHRERTERNKTTIEDVYGITSLTRELADARRLLHINRSHWGIENESHYVRDVTLGEDASRIRKGNSPTVLAELRTAALGLLRTLGAPSIADAIRSCMFRPKIALCLINSKE